MGRAVVLNAVWRNSSDTFIKSGRLKSSFHRPLLYFNVKFGFTARAYGCMFAFLSWKSKGVFAGRAGFVNVRFPIPDFAFYKGDSFFGPVYDF